MREVCPGSGERPGSRRRPGARGRALLCALSGFLASAPITGTHAGQAPAPPDESGATVLLLDSTLHALPVVLTGLDSRTVNYLDAEKAPRSMPLAEVGAIVPRWWTPADSLPEGLFTEDPLRVGLAENSLAEGGVLDLTDGQRLVGRPVDGPAGDAEIVEWEHPALGRLRIRLDDISRLRMGGGGGRAVPAPAVKPAAKSGGNDRVVMTNGDVVTGFVESIATVVVIDADGRKVRAPIAHVAQVSLAGEARAPKGVRVWLRDGSVVNVARFTGNAHDGLIEIEPAVGLNAPPSARDAALADAAAPAARRATMIAAADLLAVLPDSSRLVALASCKAVKQEPVGERRRAEPVRLEWDGAVIGLADSSIVPPLGAADIAFPGPMLAEWELPAGAERVAGWAQMPREDWDWGDCIVVMGVPRADGKFVEMSRERINADRPVFEFNLDLTKVIGVAPQRFRVQIEPGEHGPIQDRVVLKRTLVVVGKSGK